MLTSRKKQTLTRPVRPFRDSRLIIIATEGKLTEKQYFESECFHSHRVHVQILPTIDTKSAPIYVYRRLKEYIGEIELQFEDQIWLMVDVDRWTNKQLSYVCSQPIKGKRKVMLAISNPSFELWLYLHIGEWVNGSISSKKMEKALKEILGSYNKANLNIDVFKKGITSAISRAKTLDKSPNNRWPSNPGTHVYKVVEEIFKLMPQPK